MDGCGTTHLRKAGNGARLRGAPTRVTAGSDRPGALRRYWGRPVVQPRVRRGRFCRFWCKSILAVPVGLLVLRVELISAKSMNRVSDHTLTGRRRAGSSPVEAAPSALYSTRRLLHVNGDFWRFRRRSTFQWYYWRLRRFLDSGFWREILHWSGPAVAALEHRWRVLGRWGDC